MRSNETKNKTKDRTNADDWTNIMKDSFEKKEFNIAKI